MRSLEIVHRALLPVVFAVWAVAFVLSLDDVVRRSVVSPLLLTSAEGPDDHPRVAAVKAGFGADEAGLAPGDQLIALAGRDLQGADVVRWLDLVTSQRGAGLRLDLTIERDGVRRHVQVPTRTYRAYWPRLVASLAFVGCAVFLLVRVRSSLVRTLLVYSNLAAGSVLACSFAGGPVETGFSIFVHLFGLAAAPPLSLLALQALADGSLPRSRFGRVGPFAFSLLGPFDVSRFYGWPFSWEAGALGNGVLSLGLLAALVVVQVRAWRGADALGRRKLKWVLLGFYLAAVPYALAEVAAARDPAWGFLLAIAVSGMVVLPICLIIAISRYNFLDVDRVLSAAGSVTVLAAAFVVLAILVVPFLASQLTVASGLQDVVSRGIVVFVLVLMLYPMHGRLRDEIERLLFADRRSLADATTQLVLDLSRCNDPDELTRRAGEELTALLRPESCVLYVRQQDLFNPTFLSGEAVAPRFPSGSPLVTVLEQQPGPLVLEHHQEDADSRLGAFQRAVVETLGAPLVLPMRQGGELMAFLCVGHKDSGDVYTQAEVALVGLIADKVASELFRFEQAERLRAVEAREERLRRYVPGSLADFLEKGQEVDVGETEVSVLFVDLRGYASYAEGLAPDEIFTSVNRYTELVSAAIHEHRGTVVEFNGDGMMAVFGAPQEIEHKEEAAVAAGRAIVERVPALSGAVGTLSVGVGVATGRAFVGNVQAVDRLIWTALGNTTNLASRLQALTRDLGAAMIIDEATWIRAGREGQRFRASPHTEIRGRKERENLYLLPLPA